MQATLWFYIIVGLLTIVPLILFNINRVFVRKKPEPMKINWVRGVVILLLCGVIGTFLFSAYSATLHGRYEIALERVATEHAQVLLGQKTAEEFKTFLRENGTDRIEASFETFEVDVLAQDAEIRFQLGNQCTPKYWTEWEGMELKNPNAAEGELPVYIWQGKDEITVTDMQANPIYLMYRLDYDGKTDYYAVRLIDTEEGWMYDWIGTPNDQQKKDIKMPTEKNGKWYSVKR